MTGCYQARENAELNKYKCVNCGHILIDKGLTNIRCPKCAYKGLELNKGLDLDKILQTIVNTIAPDEDGDSQYDSLDDQDNAEDEAVKNAKAQILATHTPNKKIVAAVGDKKGFNFTNGDSIPMLVEEAFTNGFNECRQKILKDLGLGEIK